MFGTMEELLELYIKVKDGSATEDERSKYLCIIGTACIKEDSLIKQLESMRKEKSLK